jgi:hypothetical protein
MYRTSRRSTAWPDKNVSGVLSQTALRELSEGNEQIDAVYAAVFAVFFVYKLGNVDRWNIFHGFDTLKRV